MTNGLGSFSAANQPDGCWRPYDDSSPFNRRVPTFAPVVPGSRASINKLVGGGDIAYLVAGDPARDGSIPVYWSQPSDPVYTLHCTEDWGDCALEGLQVHVPAGARPAQGFATPSFDHDAHMTIVDQASGWEYDLWHVESISGSTISFGWGGKTTLTGDGLGSDAIAARYGSLAGLIRAEELQAGAINHALLITVPCTDDYEYPALKRGLPCDEAGLPSSYSIPMGAHLQLGMRPRQIKRLNVPAWKKTILTALATYGAYVSDTTGDPGQWGLEKQSDSTYTAVGQPDPWVALAHQYDLEPEDYDHNGNAEYWFDIPDGVPWKKLRIVDGCTATGSCPAVKRSQVRRARANRCRQRLHKWVRSRSHHPRTKRQRAHRARHCRRIARGV